MRVKVKPAYAISVVGHAAVLTWSMWSLVAKPLVAPPADALPVDLVTVSDFTRLTAGSVSAARVDTPKPLVEKPGEARPLDDPTAKVDTKEVKAARESAPAPETKPVEAKPEKKPAQVRPDQIAEALTKPEQKKPEPKKAETQQPPTPPKKPAPPAPKFDPKQVEALLDKRQATRLAAAGDVPNTTAAAGAPRGSAQQMSLSELDALRQRLEQKWQIPAGAKDPQELMVVVRFRLKPDRTLLGKPEVLNRGTGPLWLAARDSAIRALYAAEPFDMLRPENYELWQDIEITFDPTRLIRG